jgi:putative phosphoserine phosphatase / 1-acylglycerol-3-phosphate O-acyltransferase
VIGAREARLAATAALQRDIRSGPQGPAVGAFFDFDGTVVHGFGRVRAGWAMLQRKLQRKTSTAMTWPLLAGLSGRKTAASIKHIDRLVCEVGRGRSAEDFALVEDRLFSRFIAGRLYPEAWQLIREHLNAGHTVVITSAAVSFQIRATARELGVDHVLCTEPAVSDGVLTGGIDGDVLWGTYKADAVKTFACSNGIELADSYAYSNGGADVPLLSVVGNPIAVNADRGLASVAARRDWQLLRFRPRGGPGPYRIARSLLAVFGFCVAAGAAMVSSLGQDQRTAIDRTCVWASTAVLRCAGLRLRVTGAEHLRAPRPAVFVFNHQSQIDTFVIPCLLRTAFTGVLTKKAKHYPMLGRVLRYAGVTFIDHSSTGQGRHAVESLVPELKSNVSVGIAPEGRISATPQLLPFKKGAFHLAAQAHVPVIPIVIRNSGESLWRSAVFVRPGTIDVAALAPIDVGSWSSETLDRHIEQLRQLYLDTLTNWPQTPTQRPKRKWWWASWPTRRSGGTNMYTPTVGRIAANQCGNSTEEFATSKLRRESHTPQRPVDLDAEAV